MNSNWRITFRFINSEVELVDYQARLQAAALTNARSVTSRIFTSAESAQNHCQMGNLGLALPVIAEWLDARDRTDR